MFTGPYLAAGAAETIARVNGAVNDFVWGVPVLTLLIATGGAAEQNMRILTMCSGGVIFLGIVAVSVIAFAREIKYGKELKNSAIDNTEK